jgi:amidase
MSLETEWSQLDATALGALVRNKDVKPSELVETAIAKAEKINPTLNAIIHPMYDLARRYAENPLPDGPFTGVPFLLKDLLAMYKGVPTTAGSRALKDFVAPFDSTLVVRHKKAGLIIMGKTNSSEFGILPAAEPDLFGPCKNPWNTKVATGGSSGGSAAAVAAGIVPMAHGNSAGGSIRIPASHCGVFGLKPTRARNPLGPMHGDLLGGMVCEHAVTRSVRDSAALLDATAGPEPGDPYYAPPIARPYAEEVTLEPGRLRVAFSTNAGSDITVHPDCKEAVLNTAALLEELGHDVNEAAPELPDDRIAELFATVYAAGCAGMLDAIGSPGPDHVEILTWAIYEMGKTIGTGQYLNAVAELQGIARTVARFMTEYDVLLIPVNAGPPPPLGYFQSTVEEPMRGMMRAGEQCPFTPIINLTGQPAMSVPLYWNKAELPVGSHFIGRFGDEAALFRLAAQLEKARPWFDKRPPVSA